MRLNLVRWARHSPLSWPLRQLLFLLPLDKPLQSKAVRSLTLHKKYTLLLWHKREVWNAPI